MSNVILSKLKSLVTGVGIDFDNAPTINGVGFRAKRNFIVNGAMAVSQENGDTVSYAEDSVYYMADQWACHNKSAAGGDYQIAASELEGSRSIKQTVTAAATTLTGTISAGRFYQELEAQNIKHLNSKTVTLSLVIKSNWSGKYPASVRNHDSTKFYVHNFDITSGVNNVSVSIPIEADTFSNVSGIESGTQIDLGVCNEGTLRGLAIDDDTWQNNVVLCSDASTPWVKTIGNYVEITQVQLEEGSVATPFEHLKISEYLAECQRYAYNPLYDPQGLLGIEPVIAFGNAGTATGEFTFTMPMPVSMRVPPDLTVLGDVTDFECADAVNTAVVIASMANRANQTTLHQFQFLVIGQTDGSNYRPYWLRRNNGDTAELLFSARL